MKELVDSHSRSDAEIAKKWIPTAAPMTELVDSHSRLNAKGVLFGQFLTL